MNIDELTIGQAREIAMHTNSTACFINDRACTLLYEGVHFPATKNTAIAWFNMAIKWATQNDLAELAEYLSSAKAQVSKASQEAEYVSA